MNASPKTAPGIAQKLNAATNKGVENPAMQRTQAGLSAHKWLCAGILFVQMMIYANLRLIDGAGPAAWWASPLSLVGGFAVWLPTAYLSGLRPEEGLCGALRWGLGAFFGGAVCALLGLMLLVDTMMFVYVVANLCSSYLLQETDLSYIAVITALVLISMLLRGNAMSASHSLYRQRFRLMLAFVALAVFFLTEAKVVNLFPLGGFGVLRSAGEGLMAGSALSSVFILGFVAPLAQGSPRASAGDGTKVLLFLCMFCEMMQLTVTMAKPYAAVLYKQDWALRLMGSADYIGQWGVLRMLFVISRVAIITLAAQGALAYSEHALSSARLGIKPVWVKCGMGALLVAAALNASPHSEALLLQWMPWRLPVVMLPLWLACGVCALRKKKEAANA